MLRCQKAKRTDNKQQIITCFSFFGVEASFLFTYFFPFFNDNHSSFSVVKSHLNSGYIKSRKNYRLTSSNGFQDERTEAQRIVKVDHNGSMLAVISASTEIVCNIDVSFPGG